MQRSKVNRNKDADAGPCGGKYKSHTNEFPERFTRSIRSVGRRCEAIALFELKPYAWPGLAQLRKIRNYYASIAEDDVFRLCRNKNMHINFHTFYLSHYNM